ncbi:hypothetical protein AB0O07_09210 [Streptomyces sp. NPDC093085]|uniref:SCO4225 family membrane protein n=1 Tax=Streptomyces sp. NPDC093085 TaxID=3155068 RepID=UPI003435EE17
MVSRRLALLADLAFKNRASQVYLALVAVAVVFVTVVTLSAQQQGDASLAGVWLGLLAAPTVFLFFSVGELVGEDFATSIGFLVPALLISYLIQSIALGAFARLLKRAPKATSEGHPGKA